MKGIRPSGHDGVLSAVSDEDITADLLDELADFDKPTIVLFPDHPGSDRYASVIQHCAAMKDRIAILDVASTDYHGTQLRSELGDTDLSYGAAYTPWLRCVIPKGLAAHHFAATTFTLADGTTELGMTPGLLSDVNAATVTAATRPTAGEKRDQAQAHLAWNSTLFRDIMQGVNTAELTLPPGGAIAGVYAAVDKARGVWKAPAGVSLMGVTAPGAHFNRTELEDLGNPRTGKSINVIRHFSGRGTLVFGARTLTASSSEYKYISVRRLLMAIEESCTMACARLHAAPNSTTTWKAVQHMIENYLTTLWRNGALQGRSPDKAFYVSVGLGQTMTAPDVDQGRMIVVVGVAAVRPAEFITVRIVQPLSGA